MPLKTYQLLRRFLPLSEVTVPILEHIAMDIDPLLDVSDLDSYDRIGTLQRHIPLTRSLLVEAADLLVWRVDAIIVDEGQDFREDWELSLQCLLHDPDNGIMDIFYDDNQNLYQPGQRIPLAQAPFPLPKNCRNTQCIHAFTKQFYRSDHSITAIGPQGREVVIERYDTLDKLKQLLKRYLHQLIVEEKVHAQDIVVLTPRAETKSYLWKIGALGNFRLVDQPTGATGEVFCTTIHQFKGLESPIIILAELDTEYAPDIEKLLYIGGTRACNHLILLAHNKLPISC